MERCMGVRSTMTPIMGMPGGARGGDISVANSAVSFPTEMPPHTFVRGSRPYIIRFGRSIMQQVPGKCLCFPYLFRKRMSQAFACKWHAIRYYFRVFLRGSSPLTSSTESLV